MKFICTETDGSKLNIEIENCSMDVNKTVFCGQSFRWAKIDAQTVIGKVRDKVITLKQLGDTVEISATAEEFRNYWAHYFDVYADFSELEKLADEDKFISKCWEYGKGIHVLHQDLWEMVVSFIISQRNNIPNIKNTIEKLCRHYGEDAINEKGVKAFPIPEALVGADELALAELTRCGYRAEYIIEAADFAVRGGLNGLSKEPYEKQLNRLKTVRGIGDKVANCVILFGLHNRRAFPIDIWMQRIIDVKYNGRLDTSKYGEVAGVLQQYMFYYALNHPDEFR